MKKTYATMILGCKVNNFEAHAVKEMMDKDYIEVPFKEKADIYLIFTCCVTNTAESKSRKYLHEARRQNPDAYIVLVGCYVQTQKDNSVFKDADLLIGSKDKDKIKSYIDAHLKKSMVSSLDDARFENLALHRYKGQTRAFLKVEDGCNQYCSYCIIPFARGRERSAKMSEVLALADDLLKESKEIVLTGIHTGRYFDGEHHLIDLLKELLKKEDLVNLRLSSIEINEISDEMIDLLASKSVLAPHLHIPVQALVDKTLKAMNRPYTIQEYMDRITYIRNKVEDISISTDLIVGFPNESEEDFEMTLKRLIEINFSFVHVFPYARKSMTKAEKMPNQVLNDEKKRRVKEVIALQKSLSQNYLESLIDKKSHVIIERVKDGFSLGHSFEYVNVYIKGELKTNEVYDIKFTGLYQDGLRGEVL